MKRQRILAVRIAEKEEVMWYSHLQAFKKFGEYWLKRKLGVYARIYQARWKTDEIPTARSTKLFRDIKETYPGYDLYIFICDYQWKEGERQGRMATDFILVRVTHSPSFYPAYSLVLVASHELLHYYLWLLGLPVAIWHNRVHINHGVGRWKSRKANYDFWWWRRWWNYFHYRIKREGFYKLPKPKAPSIITVGGEYFD